LKNKTQNENIITEAADIGKDNLDTLKMIISPEIVSQFVEEANELLDSVEQNLLALEKNSSSKELVQSTFRSIHTLKGNAGFMEYTDIVSICHKAESFLDILRSGTIQADSEQISLLFKVVDSLRYAIENLTHKHTPIVAGKIGLIELMEKVFKLKNKNSGSAEISGSKNKNGKKDNKTKAKNISSSLDDNKQDEKKDKSINNGKNETSEFIRLNVNKLNRMMDLVGEIVISESMVSQHPDLSVIESQSLEKSIRNHQKNVSELQELATSMRMIRLSGLFSKMRRLVRDTSNKHNKRIELTISGDDTEVDRSVIEHISDPLVHLIRNSIDHGIEPGKDRKNKGKSVVGQIVLSAKRVGGEIWIEINDDGAGLDRDKILAIAKKKDLISENENNPSYENIRHLIFAPGFTTSEEITDISGRGVGLDVVLRNIEEIRGRVDVESKPGKGTKFTLKIPLTTAIIDGMIMRVYDSIYAIPIQDIKQSVHMTKSGMIDLVEGQEVLHVRDKLIPILRLQELHHIEAEKQKTEEGIVVVAENSGKEVGFLVDDIVGQQQLVIKPLSRYTGNIAGISGCSVLGNGDICLILDLATLVKIAETSVRNKADLNINKSITIEERIS
jgi:two-component system chemotaxis sensor kinase CheA